MKREIISYALSGLSDRHVSETMVYSPRLMQSGSERILPMKSKRVLSIVLAAALVLSLGIIAYAADMFGLRAMLIKNKELKVDEGTDGGYLSLTQPQEVPEEMGEAVREKVENSAKAWAEWDAWRKENGLREPESCITPENASSSTAEENEDGTYTLIFYSGLDDNGDNIEIERRIVSAEDYRQDTEYWEARAKGFPGYDYNYHVYTQEMADKLEGIAAKYALKVRHEAVRMYQNYDGQAEFSSREEITEKVNEICAGGRSFFRTEPTGYDKFYYFDEGTFAVSFFTTEEFSNAGTSCYLYNSPYGTLSSGFEIFDCVPDVSAFSTRTHTTPDGSELTVLQNGTDVFAYVYLQDSFVTMHVLQPNGLEESKVDAVLDMVDFSVIGQ